MDRKYYQLLQKHCSQEGIIKKKAKVKGYQERHFVIRGGGALLVYYKKNQISSQDAVPQGSIYIGAIEIDEKPDKEKHFSVKMFSKIFELQTLSSQEKQTWINTLKFLKSHQEKQPDYLKKMQMIKKMLDQKIDNYWKKLDSETLTQIKLEDEELHINDKIDDIKQMNYRLMDIKGISEYTDKINSQILEDRMVTGFLWKKKSEFSQKLLSSKQRWLFLVTKYSLNSEDDHNTIDSTLLPPWADLNTIYYFSYDAHHIEKDKSERKGQIRPGQIVSITQHQLKHKQKNFLAKGLTEIQSGITKGINKMSQATLNRMSIHSFQYGFELKIKKENSDEILTYNYFSEYITEINKWIKAIQQIIKQQKGKEEVDSLKRMSISKSESYVQYCKDQKQIQNGISMNSIEAHNNTNQQSNKSIEEQNNEEDEDEKQQQQVNIKDDDEDNRSELSNNSEKYQEHQNQWRKEVIKEDIVKLEKKVKNKQKILQLKRQILFLYKNDKKYTSDTKFMAIQKIKDIKIEEKSKFILTGTDGKEWKLVCKDDKDRDEWVHLIKSLQQDEEAQIEDLYHNNQGMLKKVLQINGQVSSDDFQDDGNDIEQGGQQQQGDQSVYTKYISLQKQMNKPGYEIPKMDKDLEQLVETDNQQGFLSKICCCCCRKKKNTNDLSKLSNTSISSSLMNYYD